MDNLNEIGLRELKTTEQQDIMGGALFAALVTGLVIAAGVEIMSDWDNFERGFTGQPYKE